MPHHTHLPFLGFSASCLYQAVAGATKAEGQTLQYRLPLPIHLIALGSVGGVARNMLCKAKAMLINIHSVCVCVCVQFVGVSVCFLPWAARRLVVVVPQT